MGYDVLIVGAGPAGMFAARELVNQNLDVLVIDKGKDISDRKCPFERVRECAKCDPCQLLCGIGGAGAFSDGTLNLRPDVGGDLREFTYEGNAYKLIREVDKTFLTYGAPNQLKDPTATQIEKLKRKAASVGVRFIEIPQRHIGSDNTPKVIDKFQMDLRKKGVVFRPGCEVTDLVVKNRRCMGVRIGNEKLEANQVILAPGRVGAGFTSKLVEKYKISATHGPIDIGVRVEVPAIVMDPVTSINRDPKFYIRTSKYDDFVRSFCTNPHGFVVKEEHEGFIGTNGHAMSGTRSKNTNFALLVQIELTQPIENTTKYGRSVAKLATTIGGGKPILQRMGDLRRGRRSTSERVERSHVVPTLREVTPGDVSMALPHRVVTDVIEGLEKLNDFIPGVTSDTTLLYAPEVKFYAMRITVDKNFETNIANLYVAGDGSGLSRDMVNAAATGILAARGVLSKI